MGLPSPKLDDRDFRQLMEEVYALVDSQQPEWQVRAPGDPGAALVECFAYLTDLTLYRLNRLPEKVFVELLRLIGVSLTPPSAASTTLVFTRDPAPETEALLLPKGTAVATAEPGPDGHPVVFTTARELRLAPGSSAEVLAHHCRLIAGESLGISDGRPGQQFSLAQAPVIAPTADPGDDLLLGVELDPSEQPPPDARILRHAGSRFRIWREVRSFAEAEDPQAYRCDRMAGRISFAPAVRLPTTEGLDQRPQALAAVPARGRRICAWYRSGGGPGGNVAAATISSLAEPLPGVSVSNPHQAQGGREAESLDNAMLRGPHELASLQRAVTAQDFERLAVAACGGVVRAKAYPKAELWPQAQPGTVVVQVVPRLSVAVPADGAISSATIVRHHSPQILQQVQAALEERRPIGTRCEVDWVRYKTVSVSARVIVDRDNDPRDVEAGIQRRLHALLRPLPDEAGGEGWPFGRTLHASHVYGTITAVTGVRYVDGQVTLEVDDAPDGELGAIGADAVKAGTWYTGAGNRLFRSTNDAAGWERLLVLPTGERVRRVLAHPLHSGVVVVHTRSEADDRSRDRLFLSEDYGESWQLDAPLATLSFEIEEACWLPRTELALLLATDNGLYELRRGRSPSKVALSQDEDPRHGFYAVAATRDAAGNELVAVAAQRGGGIFLSREGGRSGSYAALEGVAVSGGDDNLPSLRGRNVRCLAFQARGSGRSLWAGIAALGDQPGEGAWRIDALNPAGGWRRFGAGWRGGSCTALAFRDELVFAGSHHAGVLQLVPNHAEPSWSAPVIGSGLPIRDDSERLYPISCLGVAPDPEHRLLLIGTRQGLFRPRDSLRDLSFASASSREFVDRITLPTNWLFCSGEHRITVEVEHGI